MYFPSPFIIFIFSSIEKVEKHVTLGQMEQWVTLEKMGQTSERVSQLEEYVTLEKMGHTWKNGLHIENRVTLRKMNHS